MLAPDEWERSDLSICCTLSLRIGLLLNDLNNILISSDPQHNEPFPTTVSIIRKINVSIGETIACHYVISISKVPFHCNLQIIRSTTVIRGSLQSAFDRFSFNEASQMDNNMLDEVE